MLFIFHESFKILLIHILNLFLLKLFINSYIISSFYFNNLIPYYNIAANITNNLSIITVIYSYLIT